MIAELTSGPGLGLARRRVLTFLPAPRDATLPSGEAAPLRPARAPRVCGSLAHSSRATSALVLTSGAWSMPTHEALLK